MRRTRLQRRTSIALLTGALAAAAALVGLASAAPGDLDPAFDSDGLVSAAPGSGTNSSAAALVRLPGGALQVAGRAADGGQLKAMLARFTPSGAPDPGFAAGSPVLMAIGDGGQAEAQALARDGAGRLLIAGYARDGGVAKLFVARLSAVGAPDSSFNAPGGQPGVRLVEPLAGASALSASGIALDSQGRIVVAGAVTAAGRERAFVARLTGAGVLDATFSPSAGSPGVALPDFAAAPSSEAVDVAIDSADRPVLAGSATNAAGVRGLLAARLSTGGALDGGFDGDGFALTPLGDGGDPRALALEIVGGKPMLAGSALDAGVRKLALARYTEAGALDPGFNGGGTQLLAIGSAREAAGHALAVDASGRLVIGGLVADGGETRMMVARLGANGGLDASFAGGGIALTPRGEANGIALQDDGKIVTAGRSDPRLGSPNVLLARYLVASDPPPPPATPPEPAPADDGPPPLLGPSAVTFGEPALFTAPSTSARVVERRWELDGDGDFDDAAGERMVRHAFAKPGRIKVGLRTLDASGRRRDYAQDVLVDRPLMSQLVWSPVNPKPGQKVTFKLANLHDRHSAVSHFAWDFGRLKPVHPRVRLPLHGVPNRRGRRATSSAGPPQLGTAVLVSKTSDLTAANTFTRRFPRSGVFPVAASAVTADGVKTTTQADVSVGTGVTQLDPDDDTASATECAEDDDVACPQISVSGYELQGFPITFSSQAPSTQADCTPLVAADDKYKLSVQQKLDLGYPVGLPDAGDLGSQFGPQAGGQAVAHASQGGPCLEELLNDSKKLFDKSKAKVTPIQWNFGDGTKAPAQLDKNGKAPEVLTHTYKAGGLYNVSLTARVTKTSATLPSSSQGASAAKSFTSTWYVKKTIKLKVTATHCGPVKLNGVSVTTSDHCFIKIPPTQPGSEAVASKGVCCTTYRPFAGDHLIMGGVKVDARSNWVEPLVHPSSAKITAITPGGWESGLFITFRWGPGNYENGGLPDILQLQPVYPGDTLSLPKAKFIPELGKSAIDLPYEPYSGGGNLISAGPNSVAGLNVKGGHFYFFPGTKPALARLTLKLPEVFTGTGEVTLNPVQASASANDEVDFTMQLPDTSIGPFETEDVEINHRKASYGGGWFGGGTILLFGAGLDAPYIPPGQSSISCGKGGPSGFSISEGGSFQHGGATLKLPSDLPIVPPWVGFNCLQVAGTSKPFTLQGKVGLHVPVNGVIGVNACFLIAILEGGDKASGCGANNYVAKQAETWFRAAGNVTLFDDWELASAYFDLHKGNDLFKVAVGGGFDWDLVIASVSASVEGLVYFEPKFAFQFYGKGEFCVILCFNMQGLVSSKGVAGCATIAGFEYNWKTGSGAVFGGCDLTGTSVYISRHLPLPLTAMSAAEPGRFAPLGATTRTRVRVPSGRRAISFEADGAGGAPRITITDPRGRRYVDNGSPSQGTRAASLLHLERARRSILTVRGRPPGGVWTIEAQPGSPAISGLSTRRDLPQTRVLARVRGHGAGRRLVYRVAPVPGQRVTFFEEGRTVGRRIGVAGGTHGELRFPKGHGTAGKRRVFAIVEQNGMPRRRIALTSYVAPAPPRVPAPGAVRAQVRRAGLNLSWRRVAGAARYRLSVKVGDGRVLTRSIRATSTRVPFYDPRLGAQIRVSAEAKDGRKSADARLRVKPKRVRRITVRI